MDVRGQRGEFSQVSLNHLILPTGSMQSFSNTSDCKQTEICSGISVPFIIILFLLLVATIALSIRLGILYTNTKKLSDEFKKGVYRQNGENPTSNNAESNDQPQEN